MEEREPSAEIRVTRADVLAIARLAQEIAPALLEMVWPVRGVDGVPDDQAAVVSGLRALEASQAVQEKIVRLLLPAMAKVGPAGAAAARAFGELFRAQHEGSPDLPERMRACADAVAHFNRVHGIRTDDDPIPP